MGRWWIEAPRILMGLVRIKKNFVLFQTFVYFVNWGRCSEKEWLFSKAALFGEEILLS